MNGKRGYDAFGSLLPGRNFSSSSYRFGFNGKPNDNEVYGSQGTFQDYGMRGYDPRLGRFPSVDPIASKFPWLSPYQFAANSPIQNIDLDGLENYHYTLAWDDKGENPKLTLLREEGDLIDGFMCSVFINGVYMGDRITRAGAIADATYYGTLTKGQFESIVVANREQQEALERKIEEAGEEGGQMGGMIMYASRTKKGTWSGDVERRRATALNFMNKHKERDPSGKVKGFDLAKPLEPIILKKGTVVEQWVKDGVPGKWFTPLNSDVNKLGIDPTGRTDNCSP